MSDPVSNAEIEDVLSSIRRLVSVEKPAASGDTGSSHAGADAPKADPAPNNDVTPEAATPARDARLVLTPSFRVEPDAPDGDAAKVEHNADRDPEPLPEEETEHLTLEQWQIPSDAPAEEVETGQTEDSAALHEDNGDDAGSFEMSGEASEADEQNDDAHLKEWLTAEGGLGAETDPDEGSDPAHHGLSDAADEGDDDFEAASFAGDEDFVFASATSAEDGEGAADDTPEREVVTSELEARIAEVEAVVAARDDQWEPDGASEDAYAGGQTEPLPWEDHLELAEPVFASRTARDNVSRDAEQDARQDSGDADALDPDQASQQAEAIRQSVEREEPATHAQTNGPFAAGTDAETEDTSWYREDADAILDEDALRDLVSEIVRQELQGTLGERITRNVRKLVRREIHRAMMGQDLE
ncbi:hypothetical protein FIU86_13365 [Roseovarius sp. THAF9]|uniref:hypothetical protein n=1 Tax=Roseovarius sp. THAF9 TaxID=2587847 RepID=UPI0012687AA3|nr:hypothetical protein [Roseovarius sp. THAF9]QFT93834.1 hypothetical protein FIU86_13365 [Roseovarius sp. THAF9]